MKNGGWIMTTKVTLDLAVNAAAYNEWKIKDQEAQLMILLELKPVTQKSIYHTKTSKECWDRLCTHYSGRDDWRTILLFKQVFLALSRTPNPSNPSSTVSSSLLSSLNQSTSLSLTGFSHS